LCIVFLVYQSLYIYRIPFLPFFFSFSIIRRIFGPKSDKVTGGWRKLHNEELHGLYCLPSIVRVIKARRMRWVGHVACMGEVRGAYNILVQRPEETTRKT
jgi:hypothetical protein